MLDQPHLGNTVVLWPRKECEISRDRLSDARVHGKLTAKMLQLRCLYCFGSRTSHMDSAEQTKKEESHSRNLCMSWSSWNWKEKRFDAAGCTPRIVGL